MDKTIKVKIVTPNNVVFDDQALMITMPGTLGEFGVLPNHEPLIADLKEGIAKISISNHIIKFFIYKGLAEITGTNVNLITEFAINIENIQSSEISSKIAQFKQILDQETDNLKIDNIKLDIIRHQSLLNCIK
ncbi:MAG: ATP synthase F1 subunit epsilon [Rickettsia endosymbiont of Bryobia graminum]|nr:ATP synthase F1 subunit epsilon [Rickettsia endosymbiont of Bryobia graminum]